MRVVFFGTPDFSVPTLRELLGSKQCTVAAVVTQPDRPAGRGQKPRSSPVKELAGSAGVPVLQPQRIKSNLERFMSALHEHGPFDLGVVIAFGQILPLEVLTAPTRGCINIHASLLPRWRGAAPIQRAIMEGDRESGVCLMQMEEGLDTGAVLASARLPISDSMTAGELHDALATLGARLLADNLSRLDGGLLTPEAQPEYGVTYAKKISEQEARVDFGMSPERVSRHINGLSPFPGAFTFFNRQRMKLLRARPETVKEDASAPGTVVDVGEQGMTVATSGGHVLVTEIQLEGRKRMAVIDFIRGTRVPVGVMLGES